MFYEYHEGSHTRFLGRPLADERHDQGPLFCVPHQRG
jgi:hypothetical protein